MTPDDEERVRLDHFWALASEPDVDRLGLLRQFAIVIIRRPQTWHDAAHGVPSGDRANTCFACLSGDRPLHRHHVIPVSNGGSDSRRNLVTICNYCHSSIHGRPLPGVLGQRQHGGFVSLGDVLKQAQASNSDLAAFLDGLRQRLDYETPRRGRR